MQENLQVKIVISPRCNINLQVKQFVHVKSFLDWLNRYYFTEVLEILL